MGAESEPRSADIARILSLIGAGLFVFAAYQLITAEAVASDSLLNPLLHGVGWLSAGLAAVSLHLTARPYPRIPDDRVPCPECQEDIRRLATKCPYCGTDILAEDDEDEQDGEDDENEETGVHEQP